MYEMNLAWFPLRAFPLFHIRNFREKGLAVPLRAALDNIFLNMIADICMDGIVAIDANEVIIYINDTYCGYLKLPRDKIVGRKIRDIIKNSELPSVLKSGRGEVKVVHQFPLEQRFKGVQLAYVNRVPIRVGGNIVGALGYVKFLDTTQEIHASYTIMLERLEYYKRELKRYAKDANELDRIYGNSSKMKAVKDIVRKVSARDLSVLLLGETGTGKDVLAEALHSMSKRNDNPFVKINCAALPYSLIESELFGYAEGAFTGAQKGGKPGKFEVADGGTLFLDEIGELPMDMQAKLLRVLQGGEFERLGDNRTRRTDVRIIAATNQNLEEKIRANTFRSDLYYRLNVIQIQLPPLRERGDDIPGLVALFLDELNAANATRVAITEDAVRLISRMRLPGNVRELKNIIDRCYVLCEDNTIDAREVTRIISPVLETKDEPSLSDAVSRNERETIAAALAGNKHNVTKTAQKLGVSRMTLYRKMKKYGL